MRILTSAEYLRQIANPPEWEVRAEVRDGVARILAAVRSRGDAAVREYTRTLDGVDRKDVRVPAAELAKAWSQLPGDLQKALKLAAANIMKYQSTLRPRRRTVTPTQPGVQVETEWIPLRRVGGYAPGGRSPYPSTVLMTMLPARVAGVEEVYLASPPQTGGSPSRLVLAAAHLCEVDGVFAMGGAQALAAFAYGTESVPRVDKIVGPGNVWVAEAKRQLIGTVGTDAIAGPSELAVYADPRTDPGLVAVDLGAQAEHDPDARALVVTTDSAYARLLAEKIREFASTAPRGGILATSLLEQGLIVVADTPAQIPALLDAAAPEHVELLGAGAAAIAQKLRAAGTIFEGPLAAAALGDYVTGANHVLPTGRTARWSSPLSVYDFLRQRVRQRVTREGLKRIAPSGALLADAEGLPNHAASIRRRIPP